MTEFARQVGGQILLTVDYIFLVMLLQSGQLGAVLSDKAVLIDLISRLLTDILNDTRHLQRGSSPFHCKEAPAISVPDYLKRILKFAHCSNSIFIVSLIYIDRLQECSQGFVLNYYCVHRLLITTVMVAAKFGDDFFYKNEYYAKIGGISKIDISALQLELLKQLNYNLFVSDKELTVYLDRLEAYRDANQEVESK